LRAVVPKRIAQKEGESLERLVETLQRPERFRLTEQRRAPEQRRILPRDFRIKGERFTPSLPGGEGLRAPEPGGRQILQCRILQDL
jgi:hypothetical protein